MWYSTWPSFLCYSTFNHLLLCFFISFLQMIIWISLIAIYSHFHKFCLLALGDIQCSFSPLLFKLSLWLCLFIHMQWQKECVSPAIVSEEQFEAIFFFLLSSFILFHVVKLDTLRAFYLFATVNSKFTLPNRVCFDNYAGIF